MSRRGSWIRVPVFLAGLSFFGFSQSINPPYPWLSREEIIAPIQERIAPPPGYRRTMVEPGSFAQWLRRLPLKPAGSPVRLFNGTLKANQAAHHAVIALDTGPRNLQQCADAVIRLRAEYLFSNGRSSEICFHFTCGDVFPFARWAQGERPVVRNNRVTWKHRATADRSYSSLRRYLTTLFIYAGSHSLQREMTPRPLNQIRSGDVFVEGGFPGHAVLVVDLARHAQSGELVFLLAQSYMPAQEMHVLKNPDDAKLSPWYRLPESDTLVTPEWTFHADSLRAFATAEKSAD
jgi:hypothetical protein